MLLIRRMWLLPALVITLVLFFVFRNAQDSVRQLQSQSQVPTRIHWQKHDDHYPVSSLISLPTEVPVSLPKIQASFPAETEDAKKVREERLAAVKESFLHAWYGYKKYAWLKDEVSPTTGYYKVTFGGWAATLVDSLDSLWIIGEKVEFENAVEALKSIDFTTTPTATLNLFETTIRYLGGFLGAYDLTGGSYPVLLEKATELGEMLLSAFDTPNRMPMTRWDWMSSARGNKIEAGESTLIAEIGSLTVEFTRLSQLTKDPRYFDAIQRITNFLYENQNKTRIPGLWPVVINARNTNFEYNHFTLGGMADSTYEYLPKEYMMLGGVTQAKQYREMYDTAMEVIRKKLLFRPMTMGGADILFSGNARISTAKEVALEPQGQHLTCFAGGMVGVGAKIFNHPEDLKLARKLVDGCIWAYESMPTGLMPETFHLVDCEDLNGCDWDQTRWHDKINHDQSNSAATAAMPPEERAKHWIELKKLVPSYSDIGDTRYMLRPEAIESIFVLYRITGDKSLLDSAWKMFQSITKVSLTKIAHSGINDVRVDRASLISYTDTMESFWLAETLKYFYLIFSEPSVVSLDDYVLNTEAHPLKRP